jgi:hypothetical protein
MTDLFPFPPIPRRSTPSPMRHPRPFVALVLGAIAGWAGGWMGAVVAVREERRVI